MLEFEEKLAIIESFPELERRNVSLGRINFHFEGSATDKKNVVYHLHPNGNGFVFAEYIKGYSTDNKGMVNIRDYAKEELVSIIKQSIHSLTPVLKAKEDSAEVRTNVEECWSDAENHTLILINEDEMWNVYTGKNLEESFGAYNEAKQYLEEEGFERIN